MAIWLWDVLVVIVVGLGLVRNRTAERNRELCDDDVESHKGKKNEKVKRKVGSLMCSWSVVCKTKRRDLPNISLPFCVWSQVMRRSTTAPFVSYDRPFIPFHLSFLYWNNCILFIH